jgi:hypothetical protein
MVVYGRLSSFALALRCFTSFHSPSIAAKHKRLSVLSTKFLQNAAFSKWAMLESNQRPPPCKGDSTRSPKFIGVQNTA